MRMQDLDGIAVILGFLPKAKEPDGSPFLASDVTFLLKLLRSAAVDGYARYADCTRCVGSQYYRAIQKMIPSDL